MQILVPFHNPLDYWYHIDSQIVLALTSCLWISALIIFFETQHSGFTVDAGMIYRQQMYYSEHTDDNIGTKILNLAHIGARYIISAINNIYTN